MRGREPGFLNRPTELARSRRKEQASTRKLRQQEWASALGSRSDTPKTPEPTTVTHHGTSPNSGRYRLGKFSRGTPKIFAVPMNSLSFFLSKLLTVIPWRTSRWKRITLLSVTFMVFSVTVRTPQDITHWALSCSSISPVAQVTRKWRHSVVFRVQPRVVEMSFGRISTSLVKTLRFSFRLN